MKIKELIKKSFKNSSDKGFHKIYDNLRKGAKRKEDKKILNDLITSQKLLLIISELSESLESMRHNKYSNLSEEEINILNLQSNNVFISEFEKRVKDTFEDEIADVFIRLGDLCGMLNIDIDTHIELKHRYNETRDKMHGKNF